MGGGIFTPTFNYHVLCKRGGGSYKKRKRKKEEVQHAMKNMILESNGKDRTLKEEEEGS